MGNKMSNILSQKEVFLNGEGDAWCLRNAEAVASINYAEDPVVKVLEKIVPSLGRADKDLGVSVLEIGCGEGFRLEWLTRQFKIDAYGVDPSEVAIGRATKKGIKAFRGTADSLQFSDHSFDIVIFGFCLYLCDRNDLFEIALEADRVLKSSSWLVISDFFSEAPTRRDYHHKSGVYSYKMDYRHLFSWHPSYTCFSHVVTSHMNWELTDEKQDWVATSALRKNSF